MDMQFAFGLCALIVLSVGKAASGALSITSTFSTTRVYIGGNHTFTCVVSGKPYDYFANQIVWYKESKDGNKLQINTGTLINEPFLKTGRYSMKADQKVEETNKVLFSLTLKDVTVAEDGKYTCELKGQSGTIADTSVEVIVPDQVKEFEFFTNDTSRKDNESTINYGFESLEPTYVRCRSVGGNPKPSLRIMRGDTDISSEFVQTVDKKTDGEPGLEEVTYEVQLESHEYRASLEQNGETLKCVARVPDENKFRKVIRGRMVVRYPPKFFCSHERHAIPTTDDFKMMCTVKAHPRVDLNSIMWTIGESNGTNVTVGEIKDGYAANFTVDEQEDDAVHVSLVIPFVNVSTYQEYHLRVKNDLGEGNYRISLYEATTTRSTTTAKTPAVKDKFSPGKPRQSPIKPAPSSAAYVTISMATNLAVSIGAMLLLGAAGVTKSKFSYLES